MEYGKFQEENYVMVQYNIKEYILATMFLDNDNRYLYSDLINRIEVTHLKKNHTYPKNLAHAKDLLIYCGKVGNNIRKNHTNGVEF